MNKIRVGIALLLASIIDSFLINYYMWKEPEGQLTWMFSLLLPILVLSGIIILGRGLGERRNVVYDARHDHAPDSSRSNR